MIIDIVSACLVLLFGYLGYRSGFLVQLGRIGALVAAFFVARLAAGPLGAIVARALDLGDFLARAATFAAVFFVVALAISLVVGAIAKRGRAESESFTFFDRGLGGLLGAAKGAALVYVVLALLTVFGPVLGRSAPAFDLDLTKSLVGREVLRHNFLQTQVFPRAQALLTIVRILQVPSAREAALRDPNFYYVLQHPNAAFLGDPLIQKAILDGDWPFVVEDGRAFLLLEDIEVVNALNRIEVEPAEALPALPPPPPTPDPLAPPVGKAPPPP